MGFFEPKYFFPAAKDGFDVVIGNPPYVQLQKMKEEASIFKKLGFETFESTGDLYCLFYERGLQLLKLGGVETYITSSQWVKAAYGKSLRKYFLKHNPLLLLELGPGVFESATVDSNILVIQKGISKKELQGAVIEDLRNIAATPKTHLPDVNENAWTIGNPLHLQLLQKINTNSKPLKDWNVNIYRGVLTGYNEAFIIDKTKRDELIALDSKSEEIIRPILRGREIEKYITRWDGSYLISTFPSFKLNIDKYPHVKSFLESFGKRLHQTGEQFVENGVTQVARKKTPNKWFETQDPIAFHKEFSKEKIIWKRIGSQLRFSYTDEEIFCLDSTCIATGEKMKYLTAFLNSKLSHYQLFENAPKTGMGDLIISVQALEPLLVYYPNDKQETIFITLVDQILSGKKAGQDTSAWEHEIDVRVYHLYELSYEEACIIDPQLTKADFEMFNS